ncbi:hypothetical protein KR044_013148 [Drosophila immigrans]|nr:hypothetical protein KR044_013148 [Drosophila immigrans]
MQIIHFMHKICIIYFLLHLLAANPLQPGNVIINGDCKYCNVRGD